jgi:hypothetical protein
MLLLSHHNTGDFTSESGNHTFHLKMMAELLYGRAFVITGTEVGLLILESFCRTNFSELGPTLLSLFEYTAAIRNLEELRTVSDEKNSI